jgi:hypothetical protein
VTAVHYALIIYLYGTLCTPSAVSVLVWLNRRSLSREAEVGAGTSQEPLLGQTRSAPQRMQSQQSRSTAAGSTGALPPRRPSRPFSLREEVSGRSPRGHFYRPAAENEFNDDTVLEVGAPRPASVADSQVCLPHADSQTLQLPTQFHGSTYMTRGVFMGANFAMQDGEQCKKMQVLLDLPTP